MNGGSGGRRWWAGVVGALLGAACGGGGTGGSGDPAPLAGVFVDSPVANLGYRTATRSGRTDAQGTFQYLPGEQVTFFVGAVETPPVAGGSIVTPMSVFGAEDLSSDERAVNLARLLQTLDTDGNPDNGIAITDAAHAAATAGTDFGAGFDAAVAPVVADGGGSPTLVSPGDALAHLGAQFPLVGGWVYGAGTQAIALTFLGNGLYVMAHGGTADESGQPGIEFGTWTHDPISGAWTATAMKGALDGNGEWGFSHPTGAWGVSVATATVAGDTLTLASATNSMDWARVADAGNALVGAWVARSGTDTIAVTFLPDGTYAMAHGGTADEAGQPGIEFGTWTWDPGTGAWTATASTGALDTNGEWGFSHPTPGVYGVSSATVTVTGNDMMAGTMPWRRVAGE